MRRREISRLAGREGVRVNVVNASQARSGEGVRVNVVNTGPGSKGGGVRVNVVIPSHPGLKKEG